METLVTRGILADVPASVLRRLPACVTVDAALAILQDAGFLEKTLEATPHKGQYVGCAADFSSDCLMTTTRYCMYR